MSNVKSNDASVRETIIQAIRDYGRSLKRMMNIQHRAHKPISRKRK